MQGRPQNTENSTERLSGSVERVTFHSEESGFCVLRVKVKGHKEQTTVIGSAASITPGEFIECIGVWTNDRTHGMQFKANQLKVVPPTTLEGIEKYLGSGMVKGIGSHFAKVLVKAFKENVFSVIENEPDSLLKLPGIGKKRVEKITSAWVEQKMIREIMVFLQSHGVGTGRAVRIFKTYGNEAIVKVTENPYRLALDIHGIGFKTADQIAAKLGIAPDSLIRAQAGVRHVLQEISSDGHCAASWDDLVKESGKLLEIPVAILEQAILEEIAQENLVQEDIDGQQCLFLTPLQRAEVGTAASIRRILDGYPPWGAIEVDKALPWVAEKTGLILSPSQQEAVRLALTSKVVVITGGPGVGKAQPLGAGVLTPTGYRKIGELRIGDEIITPENRVSKVTGVFNQGIKDIYTIHFFDGRKTQCCAEHLWKVWARKSIWSPEKKKKVRSRGWRTVPLRDIAGWIDRNRVEANRIAIPLVSAVAGKDRLPFSPYLLGALLGDGSISESSGCIGFHSVSEDILERISSLLSGKGLCLKRVTRKGTVTNDYRIFNSELNRRKRNQLRSYLKAQGLCVKSEFKHIPEHWFFLEHAERIELIRGLMDTDGTVGNKNHAITFSSSSRNLAEGLCRLIWSIGGIARIGKTKYPVFTHKGIKKVGLPSYNVFIDYQNPEELFHHPEKKNKTIRPLKRNRLSHRLRITSIEAAGEAECVCISIEDKEGLYITDDYLVTHNTTLVNSILLIIQAKQLRVTLCAPTGRAAKRLSESTGFEAKTIHRLLEFDPQSFGFKRGKDNPLETDLLVIDESSMVDIALMNKLLAAVPDQAALMIVGDVDQLPSVGPGSVLADIIDSGTVPTVRLTEIFRQAAASKIIVNAHRINKGEMPLKAEGTELSDFYFIPAETPEDIYAKIVQVVTERIPKRFGLHPVKDVQILTPMNRGGLGARSLNAELQKILNEKGEPKITRFGTTFAPGDKVIQTVNDYDKEVFNGDIGQIERVDIEEGMLTVDYDGRIVEYEFGELDEVQLAYATSIHKSQGSEYPAVVIPLAMQHYTLLERNLIYTAVTRGKKLVTIIGQPKALAMAVKNRKSNRRLTKLAVRIAGEEL